MGDGGGAAGKGRAEAAERKEQQPWDAQVEAASYQAAAADPGVAQVGVRGAGRLPRRITVRRPVVVQSAAAAADPGVALVGVRGAGRLPRRRTLRRSVVAQSESGGAAGRAEDRGSGGAAAVALRAAAAARQAAAAACPAAAAAVERV